MQRHRSLNSKPSTINDSIRVCVHDPKTPVQFLWSLPIALAATLPENEDRPDDLPPVFPCDACAVCEGVALLLNDPHPVEH